MPSTHVRRTFSAPNNPDDPECLVGKVAGDMTVRVSLETIEIMGAAPPPTTISINYSALVIRTSSIFHPVIPNFWPRAHFASGVLMPV